MANLPVLLRIQEIHNRQKCLNKSLAEIEENPELIALKSGKAESVRKEAVIVKKQESIQKELHQLDLDLKSCLTKIKQEETKLYNGSVVNSRELEQIQLKVSEYAAFKSNVEEKIYKLMEEEEKLADIKEQLISTIHTIDQKLEIIDEQLKQKKFELNLELTDLEEELDRIKPSVSGEWLDRLEKIASSHNGVGIAQIKSGCCGACHVSLSEALLQKVKRGEDQILLCENCGRIVFY